MSAKSERFWKISENLKELWKDQERNMYFEGGKQLMWNYLTYFQCSDTDSLTLANTTVCQWWFGWANQTLPTICRICNRFYKILEEMYCFACFINHDFYSPLEYCIWQYHCYKQCQLSYSNSEIILSKYLFLFLFFH